MSSEKIVELHNEGVIESRTTKTNPSRKKKEKESSEKSDHSEKKLKISHPNNQEIIENKTTKTRLSREMEEKYNNEQRPVIDISKLKKLNFKELFKRSEEMGVQTTGTMLKQDLTFSIIKKAAELNYIINGGGIAEVLNEGFGFTRSLNSNYLASADDIYISPGQIRKLGLRAGDEVYGELRTPKKEERYLALSKALTINGNNIGTDRGRRVHFDSLTPLYPDSILRLECDKAIMYNNRPDLSPRIIDIIAPLGKGQRALIVAPPKTGKTMLMQNIANSISSNHPEVKLIVLLIGERPEEVTDMERSVNGEVASSTFDEPANRHVQLAELVIERAKRVVENGGDVVILLDSITRLARAYNAVLPSSGKVLTGGVDSNALQRPKRFFGAARNIENGGSLTIIATALVDTGSKMDEVIFEEFKGTGNSEIILERKLADKRIFPSIDITKSGTRREELVLSQEVLSKVWILRRILSPMGSVEAMEFLQEKFIRTKNNSEFFESMKNSSNT
ncbi:MAG: transcription termination factor Rho [Rickettsiaceae bacterium H1]|nr:transcription termination factor Rho [Rickettsiaceae bacterium H1]